MSDLDHNYSSDDEPVSKDHKKLLQAVSSLTKGQHIKKVARKEPTVTQSEFDLIKPRVKLPVEVLPTKSPVSVVDLVKTLKGTTKHLSVGKELKNVQSSNKILPKPLEKPEAERVARTINYEKAKKNLERWDAIVAQFQSAESQTFPLDSETVYINTARYKKPLKLSMKSELQTAVEEAEARFRALKGEVAKVVTKEDEKAEQLLLTKEEIKKRRQELLYLKMRESQKSAKLRMQNKIKSKKFHRLQKQQKLREQLKEFEILQKQNPEAALEKLQSLEKNRVLERANLRHKNTGTWAKNNLVKAKYNRDVQKDLSEQLALSRQLTEKKDVSDDEEGAKSDDDLPLEGADKFNPWMLANGKKADTQVVDSLEDGYRKYWTTRNENEKKLAEHRAVPTPTKDSEVEEDVKEEEEKEQIPEDTVNKPPKVKKIKAKSKKKASNTISSTSKQTSSSPTIENGWVVEDVTEAQAEENMSAIEKLFDNAEDKIMKKLTKRQLKAQRDLERKAKAKSKKAKKEPRPEKNALKNLEDLSFKNTSKRIEIDEQLLETAAGEKPILPPPTSTPLPVSKEKPNVIGDTIKHDNYADVKPKQLKVSLGGVTNCGEDLDFDDDDDEVVMVDQQATINDAFEDDDIVAEFGNEKSGDEKKALADQLTLSMPGWGSWAGTGISENQAKKKLVLNFEKKKEEADNMNKSRVRIHEITNKKLREHLVSDIPFPYTSVKDYEASIRAPIGRSFIPETAFRALTKPAVITRRGHIIAPMDENELVRPVKRPRSVVEQRILYDTKVGTK